MDTIVINHPQHGVIYVGTNSIDHATAPLETIVARFVVIREALDEEFNEQPPPRRYYG